MPVLQLDDQLFPLKAGATKIGAGAGADIVVPGYSAIPVEAIIDAGATPTIRRAEEAAHVRVNGVLLGAEPTPLMHGDKVEVAGLELRYADDAKGGATQFVSASDIAALAGAKRTGAARATAASGGRLVSLVDGKEYSIPSSGIVMGRDAACDVVVAQNEVSRRHAEIAPGEKGYELKDTSANGVFVNGQRVQGAHTLARADIVRIGSEEFRFYADVLAAAPTPAPGVPVISPAKAPQAKAPEPKVAEPVAPEPPSTVAPSHLDDLELVPESAIAAATAPPPASPAAAPPPPPPPPAAKAPEPPAPAPVVAPPAPPARDMRPVLATLEALNEGPGKGTRYDLRAPLSHVGRGAHNDVRLSDESVSETHAKIQRREDGWYVCDMDSTNGTYVGGTRVSGERKVEGSPDVRFGGLKFRFTAVEGVDTEAKGTRTIAPVSRPSQMASAPVTARTPAAPPPAPVSAPEPAKKGGIPVIVWIVVVVAIVGAVAFFLLKGKA